MPGYAKCSAFAAAMLLTVGASATTSATTCSSSLDGQQLKALGYIGRWNSPTATPNIKEFLAAVADSLSEYTTDTPPQLFWPALVGASAVDTKANRVALCAMEDDAVHYNASASNFLSCLSSKYNSLLGVGATSSGANCTHSKVNDQLKCLSQLALQPAEAMYSGNAVSQCATQNQLWPHLLMQCANGQDGEEREQTNTEAALAFLEAQMTQKAGKSGTGTGGLSTASSLLGGGRRLLSEGARRFQLSDLDFFGHSHKTSASTEAREQATALLGQAPVLAAGADGQHIEPQCAFNTSSYVAFTCAALEADQVDDSVKDKDVWAWVAGIAVGTSVVMAGIGVGVLHWHEKKWHRTGHFTRPGRESEGYNPFRTIQLTPEGVLDLNYERVVEPEPLKWLVGVQGSHLLENQSKSKLCNM